MSAVFATEVAAFVIAAGVALATGCGAEPPRARTSVARTVLDAGTRDAAAEAAVDRLPSLTRIAESGSALAPGMREAARIDADGPVEREIVHAAEKDTCARVAFAAAAPVIVTLADGQGATLADMPRAASGVSTTVCVRRGETMLVRVAFDLDGGVGGIRAVAWIAP